MSFLKYFKEKAQENEIQEPLESLSESQNPVSIQDFFSSEGLKIKSRIITDFGVQYEFYKRPNVDNFLNFFKNKNEIIFKSNLVFILEK